MANCSTISSNKKLLHAVLSFPDQYDIIEIPSLLPAPVTAQASFEKFNFYQSTQEYFSRVFVPIELSCAYSWIY